MGFQVQDAQLTDTKALPNGAATITSNGIALHNGNCDFLAEAELKLSIPALTTTELADTQTITHTIEHDDDPAFGSPATISPSVVQTGAGGVGAAAATLTMGIPTNIKKNVRFKSVKAGASNASTKSGTLQVLT